MKGNVMSTGKVAGTLEQVLFGVVKFNLVGEVDHYNERSVFGFGFQVVT
jgi:hypothetical protein